MKKSLALFLALAWPCVAAIYHLSPTGNDSTGTGSAGNPWLTLQHAVNTVSSGDTIKLQCVADGNAAGVNVDTTIPGGLNNITVTSDCTSRFPIPPPGYRASFTTAGYGRGVAATGIAPAIEYHPSSPGALGTCWVNAVSGGSLDTLGFACFSGDPLVAANGMQVFFQASADGVGASVNLTNIFNGQIAIGQKVLLTSCSGCGTASGTFKITTITGTPITGLTCTPQPTGGCSIGVPGTGAGVTFIGIPLQVSVGSCTITSPENLSTLFVDNAPVSISVAGLQSFGTYPGGLAANTIYYLASVTTNTFCLSATPSGSTIPITSVGSGQLFMSTANEPVGWEISGLEIYQVPNNEIFGFIKVGTGVEASTTVGLASHWNIHHNYFHGLAGDTAPPLRGLGVNGRYINVCDNIFSGFVNGESQAIQATGAPGPVNVCNNQLESAGENTLLGGSIPLSGATNSNWTISGNYYLTPPLWYVTTTTGAPPATTTGFYNCDDPTQCGGQWWHDTMGAQWYQVGTDLAWHTTATAGPYTCGVGQFACPAFKNKVEQKSGNYQKIIGNVFNYSFAATQSGTTTGAQQGQVWNDSCEAGWAGGSGPGMACDHNTMTFNAAFNVYTVRSVDDECNASPTVPCLFPTGNNQMQQNLFVLRSTACGQTSALCATQPFIVNNQFSSNDYLSKNTFFMLDGDYSSANPQIVYIGAPAAGCSWPPPISGATWINGILPGNFGGDCQGSGGPSAVAAYYTASTFSNMAIRVGAMGYTFSPALPANSAAIGYVNGNGTSTNPLDYCLSSTSPYSASFVSHTQLNTDGTDLGMDCQMLAMMTSGAKAGVLNWDIQARLFYDVGSTSIVIRYTSQNSAACTATLYSAPARISANQVAQVADSASTSVQNGIDRNLLITGLTAGTTYYPILAGAGCPNALVGTGNGVASFTTRAAGSGTTNFPFSFGQATPMQYSSTLSGGTLVSPTVLAAATTQPIPVTHGTPMYAQVGATGPITVVVVP